MADRIGPAFRGELAAVGLGDGIGSAADGTLYFAASVSESDKAKAEAVLAAHDPTTPAPPVPPAPYVLLKTDVVTRMTDPELDRFDAALTAATTRQRRMWTDCTHIESDGAYFAALQGQFTAAFGADRAGALLAAK